VNLVEDEAKESVQSFVCSYAISRYCSMLYICMYVYVYIYIYIYIYICIGG